MKIVINKTRFEFFDTPRENMEEKLIKKRIKKPFIQLRESLR